MVPIRSKIQNKLTVLLTSSPNKAYEITVAEIMLLRSLLWEFTKKEKQEEEDVNG